MEFADYFRFLAALIFVLTLIGILAFVAKRFGIVPGFARAGPKPKRIAILENTLIDARRRLVLVRHDTTEHLLLLGTNSETVLDSTPCAHNDEDGDGNPAARNDDLPSDVFGRLIHIVRDKRS